MARVKRSRSRDFRREQKKQETLLSDPDREMEERREKRQEQLKNDKRVARMRAKEEKEAAKRDAKRARRAASAGDAPEDGPQPLTPRERAQRRRTRAIYALVLLVTLFFLGSAAWKAVQVKAEEAAALAREEQLKVRLVRLQDELARIDSAEYIEEKARTELHMIFPGETIYIINGRDDGAPND